MSSKWSKSEMLEFRVNKQNDDDDVEEAKIKHLMPFIQCQSDL